METRRRRQVGDAQPPANNDEMVENEEEELIPAVMGPDDHRRMKLTSEELGWAQEIRDAIAAIPDLETVGDFFCVQLALITQNNIVDAVNRASGLQAFLEANAS